MSIANGRGTTNLSGGTPLAPTCYIQSVITGECATRPTYSEPALRGVVDMYSGAGLQPGAICGYDTTNAGLPCFGGYCSAIDKGYCTTENALYNPNRILKMGTFGPMNDNVVMNIILPMLGIRDVVNFASTCKLYRQSNALCQIVNDKMDSFFGDHWKVIVQLVRATEPDFDKRYHEGVNNGWVRDIIWNELHERTFDERKKVYWWAKKAIVSHSLWNAINNDRNRIERIILEVVKLNFGRERSGPYGHKIVYVEGFHHIIVSMTSQDDSPFGTLEYMIEFPLDYPFMPLKVRCMTPILHPGYSKDGKMCIDILDEQWSPSLTLDKVLLSIYNLLSWPCGVVDCLDKPANAEAATLFKRDRVLFFNKAKRKNM